MKKTSKAPFFMLLILVAVIGLVAWLGSVNIPVLDTKGWIAWKERKLIIIAALLMLIVVLPVLFLTFYISWKYRASNEKAKYSPRWDHHLAAEVLWWGIPFAIILALAILTWYKTYELDPYKPLDSATKPLTVQVVALEWKWLFIYPEQKIATINLLQIPANVPVHFDITADAPMNSFWVPALSGQIFAMNGMVTQLNFIADEEGSYQGYSANISGEGFSGMKFVTQASSSEAFEQWVQSVQQSGAPLTWESYQQLAKPTSYDPVSYYVLEDEGLFDQIVMKFMMPEGGH
ncbi:MAG: ubiquinol oxidase subunit II [Verrucomicrobia bacterium]|nr:ubiquinol oxidase subunit II [Verrucomicrobiota bacterium]MBS0646647.1 ubiquinol oxidase subunit II [Verrucomicrobiota bacterium]